MLHVHNERSAHVLCTTIIYLHKGRMAEWQNSKMEAFRMPFLEMAHNNGLTDIKLGPAFNFRLDFIMKPVATSINI